MDIYVDFQNLMSYCSNDCIATFEIYSKVRDLSWGTQVKCFFI